MATYTNEQRADLAQTGILALNQEACTRGMFPAAASIEDALACVAHLCDRVGLAPAETFRDALRRYRQNLEGDERAAQIADGLRQSLAEVEDAIANHAGV